MIRKSILKTLAYSDIFDYPLTSEEIWRFLINDKKIEKKSLEKTLALHLRGVSVKKNAHYCFKDREEIISKRLERERESDKKIELAKKVISKLSVIPTVQLVAISGALSMKNSDKNDDIDLFVITKKNTLWITRLLLLFLLEILGRRRRRLDNDVKDKICLNFLIDESALSFPKERHDLYSAHEIVQILPIFERNDTYKRFIQANKWVEGFLPNSLDAKKLRYKDLKDKDYNCLISQLLNFSNFLAKRLQLWHMKGHKTREIVLDHFLAFHPLDYKEKILRLYTKKLKEFDIVI